MKKILLLITVLLTNINLYSMYTDSTDSYSTDSDTYSTDNTNLIQVIQVSPKVQCYTLINIIKNKEKTPEQKYDQLVEILKQINNELNNSSSVAEEKLFNFLIKKLLNINPNNKEFFINYTKTHINIFLCQSIEELERFYRALWPNQINR